MGNSKYTGCKLRIKRCREKLTALNEKLSRASKVNRQLVAEQISTQEKRLKLMECQLQLMSIKFYGPIVNTNKEINFLEKYDVNPEFAFLFRNKVNS